MVLLITNTSTPRLRKREEMGQLWVVPQSIHCQNFPAPSSPWCPETSPRKSESYSMIPPPGQSCLLQHWPQDWSVANDICFARNFNQDQDSVSFLVVELVTAKCRYQWSLLFKVRERRLGEKKKREEGRRISSPKE